MISLTELNDASEEKQLEAVKQNRNAIEYIKNPSEAVQIAAVTKYKKLLNILTIHVKK